LALAHRAILASFAGETSVRHCERAGRSAIICRVASIGKTSMLDRQDTWREGDANKTNRDLSGRHQDGLSLVDGKIAQHISASDLANDRGS
jgi:hypothetical protein